MTWESSSLVEVKKNFKHRQVALHLHSRIESLPFFYLRLPLSSHPKHVSFWPPLLDKIQNKLDRWRQFNLSQGGQ